MSKHTVAIIKPDAVKNRNVGEIIQTIEKNKFDIVFIREIKMSVKAASEFYKEHKDKDFYKDLVKFMSSGVVFVLILEKKNAIVEWRRVMLDIRKKFTGKKLYENAVHGSDSEDSFIREVEFLYKNTRSSK